MKKEIEAFVNAANEQELEAAWNNLSAEEQRIFEQLMGKQRPVTGFYTQFSNFHNIRCMISPSTGTGRHNI